MYFLVGLIIFFILSFRVNKFNKFAYNAFIVKLAPDQKESEIDSFWKRIKSASTKFMKEEVISTQAMYWCYHKKAIKRRTIAFAVLIISIAVECFMY
ncbi:MAG: hypothetical protein ACNFW9_02425 [Candidatus Kerfeldbacteria bacterium]